MAKLRCSVCSPEAMRIILWMVWVMMTLITTIYYIMSFATAFKLLQASSQAAVDVKALWLNKIWRAPIAATLLGGLLMFGFNMFSCIILIKKSINRSGPSFGYGFLVAFCFTLSFFLLLVALVMDSMRENIRLNLQAAEPPPPAAALAPATSAPIEFMVISGWSKYSTELYVATEVFAIICAAMLLCFFLILVIFQGAVSDHLSIGRDMNNPYAPMSDNAGLAMTGAGLSALGAGIEGAKSSNTPQYGTYMAPEASDAFNKNAFYSVPPAQNYQSTTEYKTSDYGYQSPPPPTYQSQYANQYQADGGYQTTYSTSQNGAQPTTYEAPVYQPVSMVNTEQAIPVVQQPAAVQPQQQTYMDSTNAAASFYGQQGAFAGQSHQQL